ncbi:MAG: hypothetical protein GXP18_01565 [Gammaproteobacteria bacterium]|nr:hypothetical protein [Gammaproteobacteria bacterium]
MKKQRYNMFVFVTAIMLLSACVTPDTSGLKKFDSVPLPQSANQSKFYSVILLEVTDEPGYSEYRRLNESVFANAGCYIERELRLAGAGKGPLETGTPNRAIITYCDTPNAFSALGKDEAYLKIKPMMLQSTSGFSFISGKSVYSETSGSRVEDRLYVIKISRFNDKPHQTELQRMKPMLALYGFHAENIIVADHAHGIESPDEIAIFYFDQSELQKELYKDNTVMSAIDNFNKTYTDSFVYLGGTAMQVR